MAKKRKKSKKSLIKKIKRFFTICIISIFFFISLYLCFFIPQGFLTMGMNISSSGYYFDYNLMFTDVMKTSTNFKNLSWGNELDYKLNSDGYPEEIIFEKYQTRAVLLINNIYKGDYVFLYDGVGTFNFNGGVEVIETLENKIYLKLIETDMSIAGGQRWITITSSKKENHVRNFRLIPKGYEGKDVPTFRKDFLKGLKNMKVLRFMDATNTNNTNQIHFTDRPLPSDFSYNQKGIPFEYLIELCNTLKIDGWFCVPHKASDEYIEKMALLIKNSLNKNLKVYIEYSNETWHEGFPQGKWINNPTDVVDEYILDDLLNLTSPKYKQDNRHLKTAYFMGRTFRIFEKVFKDQRNRLVTVATKYYWEYPKEIIEYLIANNLKPDVYATSAYFNFTKEDHEEWLKNPTTVTKKDIINSINKRWSTYEKSVRDEINLISEYNIPYLIYEGGQHMQPYNQQDWPYNQAVWDSQIDEGMYDLYMKNFRLHEELGCSLFVNFTYLGKRESQYGSWGVLENVSDVYSNNLKEIAPKYKAIVDACLRKGLLN